MLTTNNNVITKVKSATKWSTITEIAAKLVTPLSTMILARLLTPEAFGVLVTASMIISFAEIFTDAGFQRYIIQYSFKSEDELFRSTTVAFWSNLLFSIVIWLIIALFSEEIARLVGNEGFGLVISLSCVCIPLEAFSSIQMALYRRNFDFKTLFYIRLIGLVVPLVVTIPLAYIYRSYWSLIIGMISQNIVNAIILTIKSNWKPTFYYEVRLFRNMLSYTLWTIIESVTVWLTGYLDVFIVGSLLSTYYMGLYRTSMTIVGAIITIFTSATSPVIFSGLSRLQDNEIEFKSLFFRFQRIVGMLLIPIGFGMFFYSDFITTLALGDQWTEASYFIGWWGGTSVITVLFSNYCCEIFRAKGVPKLNVISQIIGLCFLIPTVLISVQSNFESLCLNRSLIRFVPVVINLILLRKVSTIKVSDFFHNLWFYFFASVPIIIFGSFFRHDSVSICLGQIAVCIIVYFIIIVSSKNERSTLVSLISIIKKK